jgi:hypothetical protein
MILGMSLSQDEILELIAYLVTSTLNPERCAEQAARGLQPAPRRLVRRYAPIV